MAKVLAEGELTKTAQEFIGLALRFPTVFLFANRLLLRRSPSRKLVTMVFMKPLVNSGNLGTSDWDFQKRFFISIRKGSGVQKGFKFCQWNFEGKGLKLYAPRGPLLWNSS